MSNTLSPGERKLRGRVAACAMHAAGKTNVAPAREAFFRRFEVEVDPEGALPPEERARRARLALRAHMARLALQASRQRRAGAPAPTDELLAVVRALVADEEGAR